MNLTSPSSSVIAETTQLANWLPAFCRGAEYAELVCHIERTKKALTSSGELAVLYGLIQHLRPRLSLEIGTFFGHSAYYMAEAVVNAGIEGKVVTIDPFGEHRVPEILESWPPQLRAVTEFKPYNSMQYFLEIEIARIPKGAESPLGLVFVDGHHNFEYALYDVIRAADHLRPGGAIVIDNMEQYGPRAAALQFLEWNPAWQMYYDGSVLSGDHRDKLSGDVLWSVLIAPEGVQVGRTGVKFHKLGEASGAPISGITLRTSPTKTGGTLQAEMTYYCVPWDYHRTGEGMSHAHSTATLTVVDGQKNVLVEFEQPLSIDASEPGVNIWYQLELSFVGNDSNAHLLLDAKRPLVINYAAGV
ncbi:MAG TPA: class I SAM-dependent methyltransferase [Candidatus Obscuribacterales bacterium]